MTNDELQAKGWIQVGDLWLYACDSGLTHQRAHTRDQAIQRTAKAVLQGKRLVDVWVLPPRTTEDGIAMAIIHPPRHLAMVPSPQNAELSGGTSAPASR